MTKRSVKGSNSPLPDRAGRKTAESSTGESASLRALAAGLMSAQEESNKHLARELHDVVGQELATFGMELSSLEKSARQAPDSIPSRLHELAVRVDRLASSIHELSRRLHPAILHDLGLPAALSRECRDFSSRHSIAVEFTPVNLPDRLPDHLSLCLYRVAQEALRNIARHSRANSVRVSLSAESGQVILTVLDNGGGFDVPSVAGKRGLGLISMEERLRLAGGAFSIHSRPGEETRIQACIPLDSENR